MNSERCNNNNFRSRMERTNDIDHHHHFKLDHILAVRNSFILRSFESFQFRFCCNYFG